MLKNKRTKKNKQINLKIMNIINAGFHTSEVFIQHSFLDSIRLEIVPALLVPMRYVTEFLDHISP